LPRIIKDGNALLQTTASRAYTEKCQHALTHKTFTKLACASKSLHSLIPCRSDDRYSNKTRQDITSMWHGKYV